jgi:hypothetical protein
MVVDVIRVIRILFIDSRMQKDDLPAVGSRVLREDIFEPDTLCPANIPWIVRTGVIRLIVEADDECVAPAEVEVTLLPARVTDISLLVRKVLARTERPVKLPVVAVLV